MRIARYQSAFYFLLWCAGFVFLASRHVPWRDEYQSWLVSIHTHSMGEFFSAIRYERAPFMQYALSRGVFEAVSLIPHLSLEPWRIEWSRALSGTFTAGCVALILFAFPSQPRWLRYGLPLGILFVLEYGIISRCYPMGFFFWLLGARCRANRDHSGYWVCLALAASFHLFFTLMSGVLFAWDVFDVFRAGSREPGVRSRKLRMGALLCAAAIGGLVLFQVPPSDAAFPTSIRWQGLGITGLVMPIASGLTGWDAPNLHFQWNFQGWRLVPSLVVAGLFFSLARFAKFPVFRFLMVIAIPLLIMGNTYGTAMRHTGLIFAAALVLVLGDPDRRVAPWVLAPSVALMLMASLRFLAAWNPIQPAFDFSGSRELEAKIGEQLKRPSTVIVAEVAPAFFPVASDLNLTLIDAPNDRVLEYPNFRRTEIISLGDWCSRRLAELKSQGKTVYFGMIAGQTPPPQCGPSEKIFENTRISVAKESYVVFRAGT